MTLTEFLLARIGEDEAAAQNRDEHYAPFEREWEWCPRARPEPLGDLPGGPDAECECSYPAKKRRMLAECAAKRRIVELCGGEVYDRDVGPFEADYIRESLALPYADHADYQEGWRP